MGFAKMKAGCWSQSSNCRKFAHRAATVFFWLCCIFILFSPSANSYNGNSTVYITDTGDKYHMATCSYLKSKNEVSLKYAVERGYSRCSRCSPPIPDFDYSIIETRPPDSPNDGHTSSPPSQQKASAPFAAVKPHIFFLVIVLGWISYISVHIFKHKIESKQKAQAFDIVFQFAKMARMPVSDYCRYCMNQYYSSRGLSGEDVAMKIHTLLPRRVDAPTAALITVKFFARNSKMSTSKYLSFCKKALKSTNNL